ncbi:MAG: queuosine precursor transporter [Flavobacteriales bacterium]|nr:queuosine precursor transporter [Flavobacteriales bacterium]
MGIKRAIQAERLYLVLTAIFVASLVAGNLIFQKFFSWDFFGIYTFEISVGILPYPITFLITDIISEIYGKKKANRVVLSGLFASVFVLGVVMLADYVPATVWSPVQNETFHNVFGLTVVAVGASMMAYLLAQFVDIRVYHFWKKKTRGKHLWLRNNASTMFSQLVDTSSVLLLLCSFGAIEWDKFTSLLISGVLFKVLIAAIDTPFLYFFVGWIKRYFQLGINEELDGV